jgi:aryl carrier-like protein
LDVKNAFLNRDLEEVYMDIPPVFEDNFGSNVCKLNNSLFGLKQSPRAWFENSSCTFKDMHTTPCSQNSPKMEKYLLIVYVDDIVLIGDDIVERGRVREKLAIDFEIKDLGSIRYFPCMEATRSKDDIVVSQQKYILNLLKEIGMSGLQPSDTPMDPNANLWGKGSDSIDIRRYTRDWLRN